MSVCSRDSQRPSLSHVFSLSLSQHWRLVTLESQAAWVGSYRGTLETPCVNCVYPVLADLWTPWLREMVYDEVFYQTLHLPMLEIPCVNCVYPVLADFGIPWLWEMVYDEVFYQTTLHLSLQVRQYVWQ